MEKKRVHERKINEDNSKEDFTKVLQQSIGEANSTGIQYEIKDAMLLD